MLPEVQDDYLRSCCLSVFHLIKQPAVLLYLLSIVVDSAWVVVVVATSTEFFRELRRKHQHCSPTKQSARFSSRRRYGTLTEGTADLTSSGAGSRVALEERFFYWPYGSDRDPIISYGSRSARLIDVQTQTSNVNGSQKNLWIFREFEPNKLQWSGENTDIP
jgi:hypothetical protein